MIDVIVAMGVGVLIGAFGVIVWLPHDKKQRCKMNKEKYKDPTAEYAIAEAEKWERQQKQLEEKHGIKRGDVIQIIPTSYASGDGKIITKKVEARIKALYLNVVQLQLPNGIIRFPTYWELERLKTGGGTDGKECAGTVPGTERRDQGLT